MPRGTFAQGGILLLAVVADRLRQTGRLPALRIARQRER